MPNLLLILDENLSSTYEVKDWAPYISELFGQKYLNHFPMVLKLSLSKNFVMLSRQLKKFLLLHFFRLPNIKKEVSNITSRTGFVYYFLTVCLLFYLMLEICKFLTSLEENDYK